MNLPPLVGLALLMGGEVMLLLKVFGTFNAVKGSKGRLVFVGDQVLELL